MYGFAIKKFGRALRLADWDFETLETKPLCVTQDHCGPAVFHLHRKVHRRAAEVAEDRREDSSPSLTFCAKQINAQNPSRGEVITADGTKLRYVVEGERNAIVVNGIIAASFRKTCAGTSNSGSFGNERLDTQFAYSI